MRRILLLDDEENVGNALRRTLRALFATIDLEIDTFIDPEKALLRCNDVSYDVVMSDYRMPGMDGAEFLRVIMRVQPEATRLVLSASTDFAEVTNAINRAEVFRYLSKPWNETDLHEVFLRAFERCDEIQKKRNVDDQLSTLTPQEREARLLELQEPGITFVKWGMHGSVHLE